MISKDGSEDAGPSTIKTDIVSDHTSGEPPQSRILQRVVFPTEDKEEVLPLYAEGNIIFRGGFASFAQPCPANWVKGRRSLTVEPQTRISTGTYFNVFPASYWSEWTGVQSARFVAIVSGSGTVELFCSDETGKNYFVARRRFENADNERIAIDISLSNFKNGGFYWFDLLASGKRHSATIVEAWWETDKYAPQGTVSVGITTYNRPADVVYLLQQIASEPELVSRLDDVYVVDQGTQHCQDEPGFAEVESQLGSRLHLVPQKNLGGSGGISRGMFETLRAGKSTYHLISDDDVKIEPESILRAMTFADYCLKPTLVGGHMFSLTQRDHLHSWGERVNMDDFWWTSVLDQPYGSNFGDFPLRIDGLLHRRIDVDYNGWWMELVPVSVIEKLGLSLPFFIKWDDAEFGLRAKEAGVPTVTLPGVACWHIPWTEKTDATDWQAYYHARNRIVSALLHSPQPNGGKLLQATYDGTVQHLLNQQYSAARFRNDALEAILTGPEHMGPELATKRGDIQALRGQYTDSETQPDASSMPVVVAGTRKRLPLSRRRWKSKLGKRLGWTIRSLNERRPVPTKATQNPQVALSIKEVTPRKTIYFDSALVTMPDGKSVAMYVRDPEKFTHELKRARRLNRQMKRNWDQLAHTYRSHLRESMGVEVWQDIFIPGSDKDSAPQESSGKN